jgi:uncharacterized protein
MNSHHFEWHEAKRLYPLKDRGLDFRDVAEIFTEPHIVIPARSDTEPRFAAVGAYQGQVITVIFTYRGEAIRLISARRAHRHEERYYRANVPGGHSQAEGKN